jgi:DNA-binding NtrC family response regulator
MTPPPPPEVPLSEFQDGETPNSAFRGRGRVLVVEDEARLRELLLRAIPQMGLTALGAGTGEEALRILAREPCDILLLDLNLPGMTGLELLEHARKRWPDVQAVVLTAFGDLETARQAIHLEVADFLIKPCPLGELEQALERARRRRQAMQPPTAPGSVPEIPDTDSSNQKSKIERLQQQVPLLNLKSLTPPADSHRLEDIERQQILAALDRHRGNRAAAAAELGISLRTLYYRLSQYKGKE